MIPVVLGVAITTITEAEFMLVGFIAAIISTVAQALQTVVSKHVLREREVSAAKSPVPPPPLKFLIIPSGQQV